MAKRSFCRSTPSENNLIDLHTGRPAPASSKPVICERIRFYRAQLHMEQKTLAAMVGVTANAVSNWESGRVRPDVNLLPSICEALRITLYQLYALKDPTIKYTAAEDLFMADFRQLSPGHKLAVRTLADTLLQVQDAETHPEIQTLLSFEHRLAAGIGDPSEFDDAGIPIHVYANPLTRRADFVFTVNGNSMEPDYADGCMVLVQRLTDTNNLNPGDVGAFMVDNETFIKEYQPDGLHSYNPCYPTMFFSEFDHVYLIGRVVGILSKNDLARPEDVNVYAKMHSDF